MCCYLQVDPASSPGPDVFKQHDTFKLRWFTPAAEVPLCGHATLASAATLLTGKAAMRHDMAAPQNTALHLSSASTLMELLLYIPQ
jgi:predicted PhzF superfamily epimerase YddE/YHI9